MTVYDLEGKYLADSLRDAAQILGCSHTVVRDICEKRGNDFYMLHMPKGKRGPDKHKRITDTKRWWNRDD